MKKKIFRIAIGILIMGSVAAFFVCRYINKPSSTYEDEVALFSLSASELYNEYVSDRAKANDRYLGKVIQVNGFFKSIEEIDTLTIFVFSFSEGMFGDEGVRCTMLSKYAEKARNYQENTEIKLKGFCTGYNDTDVIIEKCVIVE